MADDDDIRADEAWERQHQRWVRRDGRRRKETPVWGWSAGTWAQMLLAAVLWGLFAAAIQSSAGPSNTEAKGWASVCAILPALLLAFVVWRAIGQTGRDAGRWMVRLLPLLLLGLCLINGALRQQVADRGRAVAPSPPAVPATQATPAAPPPPAPPRLSRGSDELLLLEGAKEAALAELERSGALPAGQHGSFQFTRVRVGGTPLWRVTAHCPSGEWVLDVDDGEPPEVRRYPRAEAPAAER